MKRELLAPAASLDVCEAVLAAGADAVYLGGEKFSARALAPNFSEEDIRAAIDLAHLFGRRIYLAVNTLLKNTEISRELYRYLKPLYEYGLDAIIVQDYGVFQFVKKYFPDLPVHVSTQMSVASAGGAAWLQKRGASRIIPARELSLSEIRAMHEATDLELECFVHGALCYSCSGQCLLSSLIGGRSGNRGQCAQPCRLPYRVLDASGAVIGRKEEYPLSLKDLCALALLPQMAEAGVHAFKIEGRMKSLPYAAGVTRIYRACLDLYERDPARYEVSEEDMGMLLTLGNRSGFTEGYYAARPDGSMLTWTDSSHTSGEAETVYEPAESLKMPLVGTVVLRPGQPLTLSVRPENAKGIVSGREDEEILTVQAEMVQAAETRPLGEEEIRTRLKKTGDTPFVFSSITVDLKGDCFVPIGQINELRRKALAALLEEILRTKRREHTEMPNGEAAQADGEAPAERPESFWKAEKGGASVEKGALHVVVSTSEQLEEALGCPFVDAISLDFHSESQQPPAIDGSRKRIEAAGKQTGYCFPHVFRQHTAEAYEGPGWAELLPRFDKLWVRSYDSLGFASEIYGIRPEQICLDHGIPVYSAETWHDFALEGIGAYTASLELNGGELAHMPNAKADFILYGYTPVMVSAQCIYRNYGACIGNRGTADGWNLSDRYGNEFPVIRNCKDCYNIIYNSRPLSLLHRAEEIRALGFGSYRISLVEESREQTAAILADYARAMLQGERIPAPADTRSYTNGHFRRGVK